MSKLFFFKEKLQESAMEESRVSDMVSRIDDEIKVLNDKKRKLVDDIPKVLPPYIDVHARARIDTSTCSSCIVEFFETYKLGDCRVFIENAMVPKGPECLDLLALDIFDSDDAYQLRMKKSGEHGSIYYRCETTLWKNGRRLLKEEIPPMMSSVVFSEVVAIVSGVYGWADFFDDDNIPESCWTREVVESMNFVEHACSALRVYGHCFI